MAQQSAVPVRPLFARVASDNVRSLKVLQRAGFAIMGTEISFANGRNTEIEETILRLDEFAKTAPSDVSSGETQTNRSRQDRATVRAVTVAESDDRPPA